MLGQEAVSTRIQDVIDTIEALEPDDQEIILNVISRRLSEQGRARIIGEVRGSRAAFAQGDVSRGTPAELLRELGE